MIRLIDLMTPDPQTVTPDTCLMEILALMNNEGYRQVPVVNNVGKLVGVITDRDIRLAMNSSVLNVELSKQLSLLENVTAAECMTRDPITVAIDTPIYEVAELLSQHKFGALPVMKQNKLVGIITVTDFLNYVIAQTRPVAMSLN